MYPPQAAPKFVSNGVTYRVVDIGEGGFRYAIEEPPYPLPGDAIKGVLEFEEEDPFEVEGVALRLQGGELAVHCAKKSIPLAIVLREQRRLRRRFPFRPA